MIRTLNDLDKLPAGRHDRKMPLLFLGSLGDLRHPGDGHEGTPEHYLPLLYVLAMKEDREEVSFFNDRAVGGSLTMTSLRIGSRTAPS